MNFNIYPNPWDLRYFQEIAHTGNLSRAAERLGVGQPALSLALKRLEEGLGVDLFLRRNRGLTLTPAGGRLLRESNHLLAAWENLVTETKKSETELVGRFILGCHSSVAIYALKDVIYDLYSKYSGIEIQLSHGRSRVITEGVISGHIDFAIVINPVRHPDLVIHKLALDEQCFWKAPKGLSDVLLCNPNMTEAQELLKRHQKYFSRTITSDNLEVLATLACAGAGVAILPTRVAKANAPTLKRLNDFPKISDEITFVYRADLPKTPASQCIIDAMKGLRI